MRRSSSWIMIFLALTFFSCGESSEVTSSDLKDEEVIALVQKADELKFQIETRRILRSAALRDRQKIQAIVDRVKANAILLAIDSRDNSALTGLATAIKEYETVVISERDLPRINNAINLGRSILVRYANIQGYPIRNFSWQLYSYRFSQNIGIFGSSDMPIQWGVRAIQQERYAISARGTNKTAVLLTPTFDLSKVQNPAYQIRHSLRVEEAFPPKDEFNESKIRNVAFRAYVSTSYTDGDKPDFRNKEKWKRVSLGKQPTGKDFHLIDSGIVSLSSFAGQKITMAFVYKNDGSIDNHNLSWAIERFELYGVSGNIKIQPRPRPFDPNAQNNIGKRIWNHSFPKDELYGLQQVTLDGIPGEFSMGEHRGKTFMLMDSFQKPGEKLLYTDPIDLSQVLYPHIRIKHTINKSTPIFKEKGFVSMVAAKYEEGVEAENLKWQVLKFKNDTPGNTWNVYTTEFISLPSNLKGKKIRLGWRHKAEGETFPTWQFYEADLRDIKPEEL